MRWLRRLLEVERCVLFGHDERWAREFWSRSLVLVCAGCGYVSDIISERELYALRPR